MHFAMARRWQRERINKRMERSKLRIQGLADGGRDAGRMDSMHDCQTPPMPGMTSQCLACTECDESSSGVRAGVALPIVPSPCGFTLRLTYETLVL
jgi:hypothetical protein